MFSLNEAFDELRTKVPTFPYEKKLSRIETLRIAITYIGFMTEVVGGKKSDSMQQLLTELTDGDGVDGDGVDGDGVDSVGGQADMDSDDDDDDDDDR